MKDVDELGVSLFSTIPVMVNSIVSDNVKSILKIKRESLIIRATRIGRKSSKRCEIYLTIGKPNFRERRLIKKLKATGAVITRNMYIKGGKKK